MPMKTLELHYPMIQFLMKRSSPPSKSMDFIGMTSSYSDFLLLSCARDKTNNIFCILYLIIPRSRSRILFFFSFSNLKSFCHSVRNCNQNCKNLYTGFYRNCNCLSLLKMALDEYSLHGINSLKERENLAVTSRGVPHLFPPCNIDKSLRRSQGFEMKKKNFLSKFNRRC